MFQGLGVEHLINSLAAHEAVMVIPAAQPLFCHVIDGLDLIGAKGRIALRRSVATVMFIHRGEFMTPVEGHQWDPVCLPEEDKIAGQHLPTIDINQALQCRIVRSLLEPDSLDAEPISSGREGRAALEMIHGSWESHLQGGRVAFPLTHRTHPLERRQPESAA